MTGIGNTLLSIKEQKEKYDATLKELLSNRQFLARILKRFVKEFENSTNYSVLQKVYSIWLCTGNVPLKDANTVTSYYTIKENLIGSFKKPGKAEHSHDLMQVIIIRINDKIPCTDHVMQLLQILCSSEIRPENKINWLRDYGIRVDSTMEGKVKRMHYISDAIEERGRLKGQREGRKKGRQEGRKKGRQEELRLKHRELKLISILLSNDKIDDARRVVDDELYRKKLLKQYQL